MSKNNKVNPGTYTQAGRLSQDDAAREMAKQRTNASPRHTEGGDYGEKQKARVTDEDKSDDDEATGEQEESQEE
jgi:hypothetical protein